MSSKNGDIGTTSQITAVANMVPCLSVVGKMKLKKISATPS
jgi:hypothetical protein